MEKKEIIRDEFSLLLLFKLFKLNKKFTIIFIISVITFVTLLSFIVPFEYKADATVLPPEDLAGTSSFSALVQNYSGGLSLPGLSPGRKLELFSDIIKSREVCKYISDKLHIANSLLFKGLDQEQILKAILNCMDVKVNSNGLIVISTTISTPYFSGEKSREEAARLTAQIANAAVEGLDIVNRDKNVSKARKKHVFIEKVLADKRKNLDSIDREIEAFQEKNKVLAIDEQTKSILSSAVSLGSELSKARLELGFLLQEYEPNSPKVIAQQNKVKNLEDQYLKTQEGGIVRSDKFSIPLGLVPSLVRQYTNLVRDQKVLSEVILFLETQRYQAAIQEESDIPIVEPLDKAEIPHHRYSPNRKFMVLFGLILGVLGAFIFLLTKGLIKGQIYFKKENVKELTDRMNT